jgi:hypothetical protein
MPDDEPGRDLRNHQQDAPHAHEGGGSANDSLSSRSLTIALFVALGVLVLLLVLLLR